jgi:outer membrane lipoprotein SlyB
MAANEGEETPMKKLVIAALVALGAAAALADNPHGTPPGIAKKQHHHHEAVAEKCRDCGTVLGVKFEKRKGEGGAVGIVAGAAAGGLIGNQFGGGNGKTALTVAGAVGGGLVGNEVQKRVTAKDVWVTQVKMRDGSVRSFEHDKQPAWKKGQSVRVGANNAIALVGR